MPTELHVSRGGTPLGQFRKDQFRSLLESGTLKPDDLFFDEACRTWVPVSQFQVAAPLAPAPQSSSRETEDEESPASDDEGVEHPQRRRRSSRRGIDGSRKSRKHHPAEKALPGWIACLFAIGAAAGIWAWAQNLSDQLRTSEEKVKSLTESVASLQKQNAILLEMAPPDTLRGVMTLEPSQGKLAVLSGVSVALYRADDVRSSLLKLADAAIPISEEELAAQITLLQSALPPALAVTLSDSSGRFELPVSQAGEYALIATAFGQSGGANQRFFWALGLDADGNPSPVISLNDRNATTLKNPKFRLNPARK